MITVSFIDTKVSNEISSSIEAEFAINDPKTNAEPVREQEEFSKEKTLTGMQDIYFLQFRQSKFIQRIVEILMPKTFHTDF